MTIENFSQFLYVVSRRVGIELLRTVSHFYFDKSHLCFLIASKLKLNKASFSIFKCLKKIPLYSHNFSQIIKYIGIANSGDPNQAASAVAV